MTEEELRSPGILASPSSQRSARPGRSGDNWNTTPRGQRSRSQLSINRSIGKRSGTPAIEYLRWNGPDSPYSPTRSFVDVPGGEDSEDLDFELHEDDEEDEGFEGLENVRACCDGRHTVGHSGRPGHHHHHHHHHQHQNTLSAGQNGGTLRRQSSDTPHVYAGKEHLEVAEQARPASPAWSFRSRTGSTQSHEGGGGGGLFSGKLRFGSKRSAKSSLQAHDA